MAKKLKQLVIDRIDLVDKGANQHARIALYKRLEPVTKDDGAYGDTYTPLTTAQILGQRAAVDEWCALQCALNQSVSSILHSAPPADQPAMLAQSVQEFSQAAASILPKLAGNVKKLAQAAVDEASTITKEGRAISSARLQRLKDALSVLEQLIAEGTPKEKPSMAETDDLKKRAEDAEAQVKTLQEQLAKGNPEDLAKRVQAAEERAAQAEAVAKAEQARREEREYLEKAAAYQTLPIKPQEDWQVFKGIDTLEPSVRDRVLDLLKAADRQMALSGALSSVGSPRSRSGGATAREEIEVLARELVGKRADLSYQQAEAQVCNEHPDLYNRYRKESRERD